MVTSYGNNLISSLQRVFLPIKLFLSLLNLPSQYPFIDEFEFVNAASYVQSCLLTYS